MQSLILLDNPFTVILLNVSVSSITDNYDRRDAFKVVVSGILNSMAEQTNLLFEVRGTSFTNLKNVIQNGIDVVPTDAPFFSVAMDVGKALEYGWDNAEKMILLAYDESKLDKTFRQIESDAQEAEISNHQKLFPSTINSQEGNYLWFSRLSINDIRINTPYEMEYGKWIPDNPFDALKCVFLLGCFEENEISEIRGNLKNRHLNT